MLINPVVTPLSDEMEDGWEGCLSVPDMRGVVPRHTAVRLRGVTTARASRIDVVAKEFFARVIQHETDHLNGVVYVDRMRDLSTLTHLAEWNKHWLGVDGAGRFRRLPSRSRRSDLFFVARIRETARLVGADARLRADAGRDRRRAAAPTPPDLVLVDLTTPGLGLRAALRRIARPLARASPCSASPRTCSLGRPSRCTPGARASSRRRP